MRIAITGGAGFVGRNLATRFENPVIVSRRAGIDIGDVDALAAAFEGVDAIAHCAGINREIGDQTYDRVHVQGTRNVIEAARRAGVKRIVMLSFLRARPDVGSGYHESKWEAEELIRASGLEYMILKAAVIYGPGDHMVDHVSRAVKTWPVFFTVGFRARTVRPIPVADLVDVLVAGLEGRIPDPTVAVVGAEELPLAAAVKRIASATGRRPLFIPMPVWTIRIVAQVTEWLMTVPLIAKAQAQILSEGVSEPLPWAPEPPVGIRPSHAFSEDSIRAALPDEGGFCVQDLRVTRWARRHRAVVA